MARDKGSTFTVTITNSAGHITSNAATLRMNAARLLLNPTTSLNLGSLNIGSNGQLGVIFTNAGNSRVTPL